MITKAQIEQWQQMATRFGTPVLTLYARVNSPTSPPQAIKTRARETMKEMGVPEAVTKQVMAHLDEDHRQARTLVILANEDMVESIPLKVDLPVVDEQTGQLEAGWGEPYMTPLHLALDDYERYAVVYCDRERWRMFEIFLGECTEVAVQHRWGTPGEEDGLKGEPSERHGPPPSGTPAERSDMLPSRDSAAKDRAAEHLRESATRMFRDCAKELSDIMKARGMHRIILMGPDRYPHVFKEVLPKALADQVVAMTPGLSSPDAGASEVLDRLRDKVDEVEKQKEQELLSQIRERGMWGLGDCLRAWQQGQLYTVAVPWVLDRPVYRESQTGYIAESADEAKAAQPDGTTEQTTLRRALPELVNKFNVNLEFLRGESKERLMKEFGGMAGLKRW